MRRAWFVLVVAGACTGCIAAQSRPAARPGAERPKNIIILIGDGMGFKHVEAASIWQHGGADPARPQQPYEVFSVKLGVSTYPDGGSYDPAKAWEDFEYVKGGATDSAAAATAIATGVKTRNGALCIDPAGKPLRSILQFGEELGKSTGVVTTVPLSHATPAGFVAHNPDRGRYAEIALEMFEKSEVDVIFGGGHPLYDDNGAPKSGGFDYSFVGGEAEWNLLAGGNAGAGVDADHNGKLDDRWALVQTRAEFQSLAKGGTVPKRVAGVFQAAQTTQHNRQGIDGDRRDDLPYAAPLIQTVPTLEEMSRAAINVLDANPRGFFLMIEGGAIDHAGHSNEKGRLIEEMDDFNAAVKAVAAWVRSNSSWDETLVIVTADHETGYLTAGAGIFPDQPLGNNGPQKLPTMTFNSGGHTNSLVPLFAKGPGARRLLQCAKTDPRRGGYIDNTDIVRTIEALLAPADKPSL